MDAWEKIELDGLKYIHEFVDKDAIHIGGSDSTQSDILLSNGSFVEIKKIPALAFGQFTESTVGENPYSKQILDIFINDNNNPSLGVLGKEWVKYHYQKKNVSHFLLETNGVFQFITLEDFINNHNFYCSGRAKASGSQPCPKGKYAQVSSMIETTIINGRLFSNDKNLFGTYFNLDNDKYFISKKNNGEIRKCSKIANFTILLHLEA